MKNSLLKNSRMLSAVIMLVVALLLVLYDLNRDTLPNVIEYWAGGALYVSFWIFLIYTIRLRNVKPLAICIFATLTTCIIEFTQIWHPNWLEEIRSYKIGYAILGTTFSWMDFPPYFLGGVLGYLGCWLIEKLNENVE